MQWGCHRGLTLYWYQEQVVTGRKVNRHLDAPRERLEKAEEAITHLGEQITEGIRPTERQLRSLYGKIRHIRDLNTRKGLRLEKRLQSVLSQSA